MSPGGSSYFTFKPNMKLVTTKFKSGGIHEKHVVATWNLGNHLSICFWAQGNHEKPVSRWPKPVSRWPTCVEMANLCRDGQPVSSFILHLETNPPAPQGEWPNFNSRTTVLKKFDSHTAESHVCTTEIVKCMANKSKVLRFQFSWQAHIITAVF